MRLFAAISRRAKNRRENSDGTATIDYEKEYDNRGRIPEHPEIFARWAAETEAYRKAANGAQLGVKYGPSPRQTVDFFPAQEAGAPLAMFIHGGWWRTLDPSMFSQMAKGPNGNGVAVAVVGYDLCPQVPIATIIEQMRAACLFLWRRQKSAFSSTAIRPAAISPPAWWRPTGRRWPPTRRPIWCRRAIRSPACSI